MVILLALHAVHLVVLDLVQAPRFDLELLNYILEVVSDLLILLFLFPVDLLSWPIQVLIQGLFLYFLKHGLNHHFIEIEWIFLKKAFHTADHFVNSLLLNIIDVLIHLLDHLS